MVNQISPPAGVNFRALPKIFDNIRLICTASPVTRSWVRSFTLISIFNPLSAVCSCVMLMKSSISSGSTKSSSFNETFPLSILLISKTSLIRPSSCFEEVVILVRHAFTLSCLLISIAAMAVRPMMAFIGVRISCDILNKNCDFAELARCSTSSSALMSRISSSALYFSRKMYI